QCRKAIDIFGQQDDHGELVRLVGKLQLLKRAAIVVAVAAGAMHHRRLYGLRRVEVKLLIQRGGFLERVEPVSFEVDGIGEHEPRGGREYAWQYQVLDLVVRLLLYPLIDHGADGFGRGFEVDAMKS